MDTPLGTNVITHSPQCQLVSWLSEQDLQLAYHRCVALVKTGTKNALKVQMDKSTCQNYEK